MIVGQLGPSLTFILSIVLLSTPLASSLRLSRVGILKPSILGSRVSKALAMSTVAAASNLAQNAAVSLSVQDRKTAALYGMFVADAVAMPVHWMYNLYQLQRDYGVISGYVKPKDHFEGSIMNLSNTGGGGRGSDQGDIIGSVINHGKKKYWGRGGNFHYHIGLDAGENTLEAQLARLLCRSLAENDGFNLEAFLNSYVQFMTTPGSHNDTYASTAHRMFFANYVQKKPLTKCADNDNHNVDAIDALTLCVPVIVYYADSDRDTRNRMIDAVITATRKTRAVQSYAYNFADILVAVLHGEDLRSAIERHGHSSIRRQVESSRSDPMVACYIDSSYPALMHFAYKYAASADQAVLASANAGGENVARGSLLGALVGAQHGVQGFGAWTRDLKNYEQIMGEIRSVVQGGAAREGKNDL